MKKLFILVFLPLALVFISPDSALAQTMIVTTSDDHTAQEEAEGKEVWEKFQNKEVECENLSDEKFAALGEYFMGQMMGDTHEAMNTMMERMMGQDGEEQMHVVMGQRLSGCQTEAQFPSTGSGFMPMMSMMMNMMGSAFAPGSFGGTKGGGNPMMGFGGWNNMMGGWGGIGILGAITMLAFWLLLILGVVALLRYLGVSSRSNDASKSALDILKERYASGEIDKKEFEERKKDLF